MIPDLEARARFVNEHLVDLALELVTVVRDGGPNEVRDVCARVPHGAHDSLAVVLAAMVDPDRTPTQLLGWVDVPLGITSSPVTRGGRAREHGTEVGFHQHHAAADLPACSPCLGAHAAHVRANGSRRPGEPMGRVA